LSVRYTDKSAAFLKKLEGATDKGVGAAAEFLVQGIQDTMPGQGASAADTNGDGRLDRFTPSNPGNPPGVRLVRLKNSIASTKTGKKMQRQVGTNVGYALPLERGTAKMHARPFMSTGLDASKRGMLAAFKRTAGRAFK
jgi:hypothetical protein